MTDIYPRADYAATFLLEQTALRPKIGVVLGSGLGAFADELSDAVSVPYTQIPSFPHSTAIGHAGHMVIGRAGDVPVAAMQGRVHLYEGLFGGAGGFSGAGFGKDGNSGADCHQCGGRDQCQL